LSVLRTDEDASRYWIMNSPVSEASLRLLILINPNASRAAEALPPVAKWFAERDHMLVVVDNQQELEARLDRDGPLADRIVIGGGDGTLSEALPALLELN
jgi:diacylglycerol kinase family enzyme